MRDLKKYHRVIYFCIVNYLIVFNSFASLLLRIVAIEKIGLEKEATFRASACANSYTFRI